jgi:E3 ubiquitin-protein ligase synoviolin
MLIFTYYGMPLHIVRDLWVSIKNLQRRIASYFRYRKITANLNERFPNPTEEELQDTDRTCIICREEMAPAACKKLPCSHIFHVDCLKMWVQRQQTCPTCRSTIPTGPRAPPAPMVPPVNAQAAPPAAGAAPAVPVAQPPQQQQQYRFGAAFGQPAMGVAVPAVAPAAAGGAGGANAEAAPAAQGAPQPGVAGLHGYGAAGFNPFLQPMMFAPPFGFGGYGMMPPPFGIPMGQPGAAPHQANMDPQAIQRQLDLLNAQLAVLQAATGQVPAVSVPHSGVAATAPPVPSTASVSAATQPSTSTVPATPAAPAAASAPTPSQLNQESADELEEKLPSPTAAEPEERAIPPAPMTEAERRREELRQRYARIYGSSTAAGESKSE